MMLRMLLLLLLTAARDSEQHARRPLGTQQTAVGRRHQIYGGLRQARSPAKCVDVNPASHSHTINTTAVNFN